MKVRLELILLMLLFSTSGLIFAKSEISVKDGIIKVRSSGICYIDPGITTEQARMIAKYDALNEALNDLGTFISKNDSVLKTPATKKSVITCLSNRLPVIVYSEGEQDVDGYPSYLSNIVADISIPRLKELLKTEMTDNRERYLMEYENVRFVSILKDIGYIKISTNKIPENFISDLYVKMTATDWAGKAHLSVEEGLKIEFYSISLDNDELYESSYIHLADSYIRTGQTSLIMGMLNKLINIDPLKFPAAYALRGYLYYLEKQYAPAVKELEKSVAIAPSYAYPLCIHGLILADQNKSEEAYNKFTEAVNTDKKYYLPYMLRGNLYRKNGKYDEALRDFSAVSALDPQNAEAHMNSGLIFYLTGLYEKAVEEYSRALESDPSSPSILYNRAISFRKAGNTENASQDYEKYLKLTVTDLDPGSVGTLIDSWLSEDKYSPFLPD